MFGARVESEGTIKDVDEVADKVWMPVSEVKAELLKITRPKIGIDILAILFALEFTKRHYDIFSMIMISR